MRLQIMDTIKYTTRNEMQPTTGLSSECSCVCFVSAVYLQIVEGRALASVDAAWDGRDLVPRAAIALIPAATLNQESDRGV